MDDLRFAVIGAGFWAPYQLAAWREVPGARPVAIANRTRSKAEALAQAFDIPAVYDDAEAMLAAERPDFVDIITSVEMHSQYVHLAASHGVPVICQKPLGTSYAEAEEMVSTCRKAGVPLMVHENWRWQTPIRRLKAILDEGKVGRIFRARIQFCCSFPVFDNQPFLKELDQFILTDIGSHVLDTARFLFGEATTLTCHTDRIHREIRGEDVATVMMRMGGATVVCDMSYASRTEYERFPETYVFAEGEKGSVELGPDYWIRITTGDGTHAKRYPPPRYAWADPAYDLVHASMVPTHVDCLEAIRTGRLAETAGEDNLRTARLVFAAYEAAATGESVRIANETLP